MRVSLARTVGPGMLVWGAPVRSRLQQVEAQPWTRARRDALWARWQAGDLHELSFDAVVFRTGPNANYVRFREGDLPGFAASFSGQPFLRNHAVEDIGAREGIVTSSRLGGSGFGREFVQTIRLTTRRGIRSFLEGVIDRFSIGWHYAGITCSVCGGDWLGCDHWPGRRYGAGHDAEAGEGLICELIFEGPVGKETSAVNAPAVPGTRILDQLWSLKEATHPMEKSKSSKAMLYLPNGEVYAVEEEASPAVPAAMSRAGTEATTLSLVDEVRRLQAALQNERMEAMIEGSGLSAAGKSAVRLAAPGHDAPFVAQLIEAQRQVDGAIAGRQVVQGMRPITAGAMQTPDDRVQAALNWVFGAQDEPTPPPSLRSLRELYLAITGDGEWQGVFRPEWSRLSAASTTTLAGMVVNALNKVVRQHYDNMATYRWYEPVVDVLPHDGSTHDVQLILVDGVANLPTVGEGAAYTEATVGDAKESFAFTKRGHYVGITLETIRRSQIQRLQAIPRELVKASIRTRSAAIAAIFTQNSGTGPTLADDSTVLFHATHGNLGTGALDASEWGLARQRIFGQTVPGTSSPLGLWPSFCLVPIELYDSALTLFGYGTGDVGKPNTAGTAQEPNPYGGARPGDPRPIPVAVPEWTDANDWAYVVDPRLHPVVHMAYANAPQGGSHPLPEIFEATNEASGLIFTNDTLPVKIRDWWGYGVSTYVGIGKNNVS